MGHVRGLGQIIAGTVLMVAGSFIPGIGQGVQLAGISMIMGGVRDALTKLPPKPRDPGQNISDPFAALPIVFGTAAKLGNIRVAASSVNTVHTELDQRYLWLVCAVAHGPVSSFGKVYFDGQLAVDTNGRAVDGGQDSMRYYKDVGVWFAYGTDGQGGICPKERGGKAVTNSTFTDGATRRLTLATGHGFVAGDVLEGSGVTGMLSGTGYNVLKVTTAGGGLDYVDIGTAADSRSLGGGGGGTVDYYTPDLTAVIPNWLSTARGRGIAFMVVRLGYDEATFPGGAVPRITVDVTGGGADDPRAVVTKTCSAMASGGALGPYATTTLLTITSHGFSEGQLFRVSGSGTTLDGVQRADRIIDANTIQIASPFANFTGTFVACTVTKLVSNDNPALALRQYLTNPNWGVSAATTELDDTAFSNVANTCDTLVWAPVPNTRTVKGTVSVFSITSGASAVINTGAVPHGYQVGQTVKFDGNVLAPELQNQRTTISAVTSNTFTVPIAVASNWGAGGTAQLQQQQKQFQLGGSVMSDQTMKSNIEQILQAMRGILVFQGGLYAPSIRQAVATTMTLDESTIVGDWTYHLPGQQEMVNSIRATYMNPTTGQPEQVDFPGPGTTNGFLATDQNQLNQPTIDLQLVADRARAQQIAMVRRRESRVAIMCQVTAKETALQLAVNDLVGITHTSPGWVNKPFWVTQVQPLPDATVRLSLEAYDSTAYNLDANDDTPFADTTTLPVIKAAPGVPQFGDIYWDQSGNLFVTLVAQPASDGVGVTSGFRLIAQTGATATDTAIDAATFQDLAGAASMVVNLGATNPATGVLWPTDTAIFIGAAAYTQSDTTLARRSTTAAVQTVWVSVDTTPDGNTWTRTPQGTGGDSFIENGNFEASSQLWVPTSGTIHTPTPPGWKASANVSSVSYDTTTPYAGTQSVTVVTSAVSAGLLSTRYFKVRPGDTWKVDGYARSNDGVARATIQLMFLDKNKAYVAGIQPNTNSTSWTHLSLTGVVPATAVWGQMSLQTNTNAGSVSFDDLWVGRIRMVEDEVKRGTGSTPFLGNVIINLTDDGGALSAISIQEGGNSFKLYRHREDVQVLGPDSDGDVAVTFVDTYQNVPMIVPTGGQYVTYSSTLGSGVKQRLRLQALNATNTTFTSRSAIVNTAVTTPQANDFPSGNSVTTQGGTTQVSLSPGGANDSTYYVQYYVQVTVDANATNFCTATLVVEIDTSTDGGTTWTPRATYNYAVQPSPGPPPYSATTNTWSHETKGITVTGLTTGTLIRLRAQSFSISNGGTGSFILRGGDGAGTNPETFDGVTYNTAAGDVVESAIPSAGDEVDWMATEVV